MRIEWIEVENFKGFDKRRFEFDEHFTLIVGENGSGKSSVIRAVRLILWTWLECSRQHNNWVDLDAIRFCEQQFSSGSVIAPVFPMYLRSKVSGVGLHDPIVLEILTEERITIQQATGKLYDEVRNLAKKEQDLELPSTLPLFRCFDALRRVNTTGKPDLNKALAELPKRSDGYLDWETSDTIAQQLAEWMVRWQAIAEEEKREPTIFSLTKAAVVEGVPWLSGMRYSARRSQLVIDCEGRGGIDFSRLSDGQRAIISMIGDIARRCALLNPHLENPTAETPGVVLIDEIDLHLHPRWQRRIMEDLRRVFPRIQFIATTHSPIIISAAKDAKIISLDADGSHEIPQAYGMDVNWVVDVVQGAEPQAHEVVELVRRIESFIEDAKLEEARKLIPELERLQNGPSPDSVRLNAEMDTLIALANAED